ncbi:MAG: hypothetical protein Q7L07_19610, partial [Pseudohongiella sp.]|nr:hypothetical protein [Pseudohongiella sp.]
MGSNSIIKRRLTPHTLPRFLLTVWLLVCLSTSQAVAVTVPEADADPHREGQVLPALGISETFGRWTDVIRLGYNPTGAIPEFANTQQFLTILSDAAKIWERVSGVRFEILPAGNYPADHNNAQSSRDGIVNVFWA